MPSVTKKHANESGEQMLRRFKRAVENANTLEDYRAKEFFEKPSAKRKRAQAAAKKRAQKLIESDSVKKKRLY